MQVSFVTHPGGVKTVTTIPNATVTQQFILDDVMVLALPSLVTSTPFVEMATPDDPCPDEMQATLVGFGKAGAQPLSCGLVVFEDRTFAASNDWTFDAIPNYYKNAWNLTGYHGGLQGDSGGALLHGGRLCGVHVRHEGFATCTPLGAINTLSIAVAVQGLGPSLKASSAGVSAEQAVIYTDPQTGETQPIGTCPASYFGLAGADPSLKDVDTDGDGMPDLCDTCPELKNSEQFTEIEQDTDGDEIPDKCDACPTVGTPSPDGIAQRLATLFPQADTDNDGVGDLCDWCTGSGSTDKVYSQRLHDCNFEAELGLYYPGATEAPVVPLGPTYENALAKYHQAFKIGTCESAPCPQVVRGEGAWPPGQETQLVCIPPVPGDTCHWSVRNGVDHQPQPSPSTQSQSAITHAKWCNCPFADVTTLAGRVACQQIGCVGNNTTFDDPQWLDIHAAYFGPGQTVDWSAQPIARYHQLFDGATHPRTFWNYRALGSPYVLDKTGGLFVEGVGESVYAYVNGVLWNDTREGFGIPPGSAPEHVLQDRGSEFESGRAEVVNAVKHSLQVPVDPGWDLWYPCKDCPFGVGNLLIDPTLVVDGSIAPVVSAPTSTHIEAVLSSEAITELVATRAPGSNVRFIAAAEPLGVLDGPDGSLPAMRGAFVDLSTGAPTAALESISLFGTVRYQSRGLAIDPPDDPGVVHPDEALVLSAGRHEIFRFGGLINGAVPDRAWVYRMTYRRWIPTMLNDGGRPGRVIAATYRLTDARVYSVDRGGNGQSLYLRRWLPGTHAFEMLAKWPAAWSALDRYWLVTSEAGDLVLVGAGGAFSTIVRLEIDEASNSIKCSGIKKPKSTVVDRPFASPTGIALTVDSPKGPRQQIVHYADLGAVPGGWCPKKP